MSHTTARSAGTDPRPRGRRGRRTVWWAGGLAVLLAGYAALDAVDAVPGPLTTAPPIEVQALPSPAARAVDVPGPSPLPADAPVPQDLASIVEPEIGRASCRERV